MKTKNILYTILISGIFGIVLTSYYSFYIINRIDELKRLSV